MKITGTTSNSLDLDKCYLGHDPGQHSRGFSRPWRIMLMPAIL